MNNNEDKNLKCDDCGQVNSSVKYTLFPYEEEINDKEVELLLCDDCYDDRCMDI